MKILQKGLGELIEGKIWISWIVILGLSILVRLPHFLSVQFCYDDDEALIGIMAQNLIKGIDIPFFFYGQNYGLSFFETLSVALFLPILGSNIWALRMGGLLIFSLGLSFIWKVFREKQTNLWLSIAILILFITFPTWYLFGAMVRGGYVTALAASCILFYLTQLEKQHWVHSILIAILLFIGLEAHVLIAVPVIPFVIGWWLKHPRKTESAIIISSLVGLSMLFVKIHFAQNGLSEMRPVNLESMNEINLRMHLKGWLHGFSSFYFFNGDVVIPPYWVNGLNALFFLMMAFLLIGIIQICLSKPHYSKIVVIVTVMLAILCEIVLFSTVDEYSPRYFIGLFTGVLFLLLYLSIQAKFRLKKWMITLMAVISLIGISSGSKMWRDYHQGGALLKHLAEVYDYAQSNGCKAIIALNDQFIWNFQYGGVIPATNLCWHNRTDQFSSRVKKIFEEEPNRLMLFGFNSEPMGLEELPGFIDSVVVVNSHFFILPHVTERHLQKGREKYFCYE